MIQKLQSKKSLADKLLPTAVALLAVLLTFALTAWIVLVTWNIVMPELGLPELNMREALALYILSQTLFRASSSAKKAQPAIQPFVINNPKGN